MNIKHAILMALLLAFSIENSFSQNTKATKNQPPATTSNSQNAIDIRSLYIKLENEIKQVKADPFDPQSEKNQRRAIFSKYDDIVVFVPDDKHKYDDQNISSLSYSDGSIRLISFKPQFDLGYVTWFDGRNGGCPGYGYSAYTFYSKDNFRFDKCGSQIGKVQCRQPDGRIVVEISGVDVDTARKLSGNIERYVRLRNITYISKESSSGLGDYLGEGRYRCSGGNKGDRFLISTDGFDYYYIDKKSGQQVLSLSN